MIADYNLLFLLNFILVEKCTFRTENKVHFSKGRPLVFIYNESQKSKHQTKARRFSFYDY